MSNSSEFCIGLDVHEPSIAIAEEVGDRGRSGI